jgi:transposase
MEKRSSVTIGMDVSDKASHLVVLDDAGVVVLRDRIGTKESAVRKWFEAYAGARVALEVGRHSPWLSRLLTELGLEVIVANPRKVALIHGSDTKNDRLDAERLARLARLDPALLSPVQHRRADTQAALAIIRSRDVAVACRTRLINSVRGQVAAAGGSMRKGTSSTFHKRRDELPEPLESALLPLMDLIEAQTKHIRHYDRVVAELCRDVYPETAALLEVDGVGPVTALAFYLTIEEPGRFQHSREVGSYFGLRPRQDQSGDVDKQLGITHSGDRMLRKLLVQCAQHILGPHGKDCDLRRHGHKLAERGGKAAKRKAIVAIARRLAVLMHRLLTTGEAYDPDYCRRHAAA